MIGRCVRCGTPMWTGTICACGSTAVALSVGRLADAIFGCTGFRPAGSATWDLTREDRTFLMANGIRPD